MSNAIQVGTLDGDGLASLHVLRRISAGDSSQRNGDVHRGCQARSSVENNRTRGRGLRNLHLDRLAIFGYCKVGDTSY